MTTRNFTEQEFIDVTDIIIKALTNRYDENILKDLKKKVLEIANKYPIYK